MIRKYSFFSQGARRIEKTEREVAERSDRSEKGKQATEKDDRNSADVDERHFV